MNEKHFENFVVPRLDIKEVLKESISIYKAGFKPLFMLSCVIFIVNFFNNIIDFVVNLYKSNTTAYLVSILLTLVIFGINIYISSRAGIGIYILAEKFLRERELTAKEAYANSRSVFWRYVGVAILFGIILVLPMMGIFISYKYINNIVLKYCVMSLLATPAAYLGIRYGFAPISAILKVEKHKYFETSKLIVEGDFWRILILVLLSSIIFIVPYQIYIRVLLDYSKMGDLHKFISSSVNQFMFVFTTPFSYIVSVDMYLTLKRNKRIG